MYNLDLRTEMIKFSELLNQEFLDLTLNGEHIPDDYDLVIDRVETKEKKIIWQYYYVDHETKTLFWLEAYKMHELLHDVLGVEESSHISEWFPVQYRDTCSHQYFRVT
jgi:hypothetical protein